MIGSKCPHKAGARRADRIAWAIDSFELGPVQTVNVKGKGKRRGTIQGRRKGWKKAFVCLKAGQEIQFAEGGVA